VPPQLHINRQLSVARRHFNAATPKQHHERRFWAGDIRLQPHAAARRRVFQILSLC